MKTFPGNKKKVTSVFEVNYDYNTDTAWISYLLKYDSYTKDWTYNDQLSSSLVNQLKEDGEDTLEQFQTLLSERARYSPMKDAVTQPILFKDEGGAP